LLVAACGQRQIGGECRALGHSLDLATIAAGASLKAAIRVAGRLAPYPRDRSAIVDDGGGEVKIVAIASAPEPQMQTRRTGALIGGAASDALAGAVGPLDNAGPRPCAVQDRERTGLAIALGGACRSPHEHHSGDRSNLAGTQARERIERIREDVRSLSLGELRAVSGRIVTTGLPRIGVRRAG
jgi:hypothetical protein